MEPAPKNKPNNLVLILVSMIVLVIVIYFIIVMFFPGIISGISTGSIQPTTPDN